MIFLANGGLGGKKHKGTSNLAFSASSLMILKNLYRMIITENVKGSSSPILLQKL
jgi:hypothetical protein